MLACTAGRAYHLSASFAAQAQQRAAASCRLDLCLCIQRCTRVQQHCPASTGTCHTCWTGWPQLPQLAARLLLVQQHVSQRQGALLLWFRW